MHVIMVKKLLYHSVYLWYNLLFYVFVLHVGCEHDFVENIGIMYLQKKQTNHYIHTVTNT